MKNALEAYAAIDYGYWMLKQIQERISKPVAPIDRAIEIACNYNPTIEAAKQIAVILVDIIEAKKLIEADYSGDEKMLQETQKLLTPKTTQQ